MAITPSTFKKAKKSLDGKGCLICNMEVHIDRVLSIGSKKNVDLLGIPNEITLEMKKEIIKIYKKAGWKSVIFRQKKKYPCLTIYLNY